MTKNEQTWIENLLKKIIRHDKTSYRYGDPLRNDSKPRTGQRFLTPSEPAQVALMDLWRDKNDR